MANTSRRPRAARRRARASRGAAFNAAGGLPRAVVVPAALGQVHRIARTFNWPIARTASDIGRMMPVGITDLPSSSEFTALFMEWRIDSVQLHFQWEPSNATGPTPRLLLSYDPTAFSPPQSANDIYVRRHHVWNTSPTSRDFVLTYKPRVAQTVYLNPAAAPGTATANAVLPASTFISTSTPDVKYGNLVSWISFYNDGNASSGELNVFVTLHMSLRGTR